MKDQWKDHWNDRYSTSEFIYGKEPNRFFEEELNKLNPGKILFLGEGEGRNAVYAASLGWSVDAVDQSETGKMKAMQLSSERKVKINYYVEDLYSYKPKQNHYDAAVFIFLHLEESLRSIVFKKAIDSLKPGGKIILEVFEKDQIKYDSGGPKDETLLYSLENISEELIELCFEKFSKEIIILDEGKYHQGKASVIRFVGEKHKQKILLYK
ncbi:MAG: class I SAM-dependent methyltransferase [Ignavibacteriales bacterium]|nr:class I SAM-dependent methyltransferase [Ignavibacteriales bacterium]